MPCQLLIGSTWWLLNTSQMKQGNNRRLCSDGFPIQSIIVAEWKSALVLVRPGRVISWQQRRFKRYWWRLSQTKGPRRPPVGGKIRPLWGMAEVSEEGLVAAAAAVRGCGLLYDLTGDSQHQSAGSTPYCPEASQQWLPQPIGISS